MDSKLLGTYMIDASGIAVEDVIKIAESCYNSTSKPMSYADILHSVEPSWMPDEYELSHDHLAESLQWSIEGEDGIIRVDENGVVTAEGVGTVYVVATVSEDGFEATGRCRIDVTEHVRPEGIQLSATTLTTELYKTDYTGFEILLQLPQNYPVDGTVARTATMAQAGSGVAMTTACFTESEVYGDLSRYFQLVILDDRSVRIIPTDYAVENPKEVKSQYKNITITATAGEASVSTKGNGKTEYTSAVFGYEQLHRQEQ